MQGQACSGSLAIWRRIWGDVGGSGGVEGAYQFDWSAKVDDCWTDGDVGHIKGEVVSTEAVEGWVLCVCV